MLETNMIVPETHALSICISNSYMKYLPGEQAEKCS